MILADQKMDFIRLKALVMLVKMARLNLLQVWLKMMQVRWMLLKVKMVKKSKVLLKTIENRSCRNLSL